ncbi:MAG: hypothetical protein ACE5GQ_08330 [Nitrospinales bacterium]
MRLSEDQIRMIQNNIGLKVVPQGSQALAKLEDEFGAHTFFLSETGLLTFEEEEADEKKGNGADQLKARLFIVAIREDDQPSALLPLLEPGATEVLVDLNTGAVLEAPDATED